ncbi:MAG: hypothetical protein LR015_15280 [Verrucomicrobia bacterium]|nr:hypothetical protein [Verrucomicrobiota bacterium]
MILSSADIASLAPIIYSLLLVWGLLDCFFGHPLFKITVAVFGMFAGALLGAQIGFIWFDGRWLPAVIGLVTGGIAGALLAYYCILAGAAIFGGLFGAVLIFASMQHISPEIAGVAAAVGGVVFAFISVVLVAQ